MPDFIRSFVLLLIFLAVAGGLCAFVLPEGATSDTAAAILSAVTLLCVLSPLFALRNGIKNAELSFAEPAPAETAGLSELEAAGRAVVENVIADTVAQYTDVPYRTELAVHIADDSSIDIQRVRVIFARSFPEAADLAFALKNALGIAPETAFESEGSS